MRAEKQLLLDEIKEKIGDAPAFILTRYSKMDPNLGSAFRLSLREVEADFEVVRKRIFLKAVEAVQISLDPTLLGGHIGVVFAHRDLLQAAKTLFKFKGEHEGVLDVIGGRCEGVFYSANEVMQLSQLPNREEMRAQLLGTLEAPAAHLVGVLEALLTGVVYCMDNKIKEKSDG